MLIEIVIIVIVVLLAIYLFYTLPDDEKKDVEIEKLVSGGKIQEAIEEAEDELQVFQAMQKKNK